MQEEKLCTKCVYHATEYRLGKKRQVCSRIKDKAGRLASCIHARRDLNRGACGEDGKHWVNKQLEFEL